MYMCIYIYIYIYMCICDHVYRNTRIIARNHYSQIPPRKVLYPGVKSTQNGPSWAIMGYF